MEMLLNMADDDDVSLYDGDEFAMDPVAQRENAKRPMTAAAISKYKFVRRLGGTAYLARENNIRQDWRVIRKLKLHTLPMSTIEDVMEQLKARKERLTHPGFIDLLDLFEVDKQVYVVTEYCECNVTAVDCSNVIGNHQKNITGINTERCCHVDITSHFRLGREVDKWAYVVTEYCEGGTLGALVSRAKRYDEHLNEIEILDWLVQLLQIADHLQQQNMVHGLIATGNILLKNNRIKVGETKQGKEFMKIPDIFKLVYNKDDSNGPCAHAPSEGRVTSSEMTYYSPEVIQGSEFTHKADIWAIGCVLYEQCSQKRIFMGPNLDTIVDNITEKPLPTFPTYFSLDLANLWRSIMIKDPQDRPTAQDIMEMPFMKEHIEDMVESEQQWKEKGLETIDEDR